MEIPHMQREDLIMSSKILVKIGSGNGLLPDGTKLLPEPMLSYYQENPLAFIPG